MVIAKAEGDFFYINEDTYPNYSHVCFNVFILGLATVKYIYGLASVSSSNDAVIGSSISGRLEAGISLRRFTTINMPMKGLLPICSACYLYSELHPWFPERSYNVGAPHAFGKGTKCQQC